METPPPLQIVLFFLYVVLIFLAFNTVLKCREYLTPVGVALWVGLILFFPLVGPILAIYFIPLNCNRNTMMPGSKKISKSRL